MARVTRRGLMRNSAFALLTEVWRIGSRFVLTPLILASIGIEGYGIWTLLFSFTGQLALLNISFGAAYAKLTAEYDAQGRYVELAEELGSGMLIMAGVSLLGGSILYLARDPLLRLTGVPPDMLEPAAQALMVVLGACLFRLVFGPVRRVLEGLQRLDLVHLAEIGVSVLEFGVSCALVLSGWGLMGLAIGFAVAQITDLFVSWALCSWIEPRIVLSPFRATRDGMWRILHLGGRFQVVTLVWSFVNEGPKLLISGLLGVGMLGIYELANKLIGLGGVLGGAVAGPLMAAFANLHATDAGHARVNQLYDDASRALGIALAVSFVFLFLFADQAVIIWTGEAYPTASWTLRALAIGQLPHALTAVGTASLRARGRLGLELAFAGLRAALLALCVLPMYWAWGYGGVVATCSAAAVISSFAFFLMFARVEDFDLTGFARLSLWWPARALAPATLASLALSSAALVPLCFTNVRYQTCLEVAVYGLVFALVAMTGVWFNVLSGTERRAVVALVAQRLDTAA